MQYLDTSLVVALITSDRHTDEAQAWLGAQAAGELVVSRSPRRGLDFCRL